MAKPKPEHSLPCDSKWDLRCSYFTSLRATASSSASSPFSKGQHTSMMVTLVGSSITISGRTVDPLSFTV